LVPGVADSATLRLTAQIVGKIYLKPKKQVQNARKCRDFKRGGIEKNVRLFASSGDAQ
jgi:hypothetical protein